MLSRVGPYPGDEKHLADLLACQDQLMSTAENSGVDHSSDMNAVFGSGSSAILIVSGEDREVQISWGGVRGIWVTLWDGAYVPAHTHYYPTYADAVGACRGWLARGTFVPPRWSFRQWFHKWRRGG